MTPSSWRLIPSSFVPPSDQMEFDRRLFKDFRSSQPPILRFYRFERPTFTLGRLEAGRMDLSKLPYPYQIRPTGGWTVLHGDGDLCYSILASTRDPLVGSDLLTSYGRISRLLADGLRALGRKVELSHGFPPSTQRAHCFALPSNCEILLNGRKVAGGAQAREGHVFLQQGVLLLSVGESWRETYPADTLENMTGLNDVPDVPLGLGELEKGLVLAFEKVGIHFEKEPVGAGV